MFWTLPATRKAVSAYGFRSEDKLIAGDTLFLDSIGRTDLPGGDYQQILRSIHAKILPLDDKHGGGSRSWTQYDHRPGAGEKSFFERALASLFNRFDSFSSYGTLELDMM